MEYETRNTKYEMRNTKVKGKVKDETRNAEVKVKHHIADIEVRKRLGSRGEGSRGKREAGARGGGE